MLSSMSPVDRQEAGPTFLNGANDEQGGRDNFNSVSDDCEEKKKDNTEKLDPAKLSEDSGSTVHADILDNPMHSFFEPPEVNDEGSFSRHIQQIPIMSQPKRVRSETRSI